MMRRESKKRPRSQILRSPEWIAKHKEMFLKAVAIGHAPTRAAKLAKVGRSTVYEWRSLDADFARAWVDAVEQGLDLVEDRLMRSAITGDNDAIRLSILRARRPNTWAETRAVITHERRTVTLEEATKRLQQLGVPVPVLEGDYDVIEEGDPPKE